MQAAKNLFDAAGKGNIEEIHALLAAGANPNALNNNLPPIYVAALHKQKEAAMVLLEVTDPKLLSNKGLHHSYTMLHCAARNGMEELVKATLVRGANPNVLNHYNVPAIYEAVAGGHEAMAMFLLEVTDSRLLNNQYSSHGYTLLHSAAGRGMGELVKAVLAKGADPDVLNQHNVPAIWEAVTDGHEALAMALLEVTDPRLLSNEHSSDGTFILQEAAKRDMKDFVRLAIARGANPDALSTHNVPAVWYASNKRHEEMAIALLAVTDAKLLNNKHSSRGTTVLHEAAFCGVNLVKATLARGADPDVLEINNVPAVWYASGNDYEAMAMDLLEVTDAKLLSNKHSYDGSTTLHGAAKTGKSNFVKAIIARNADPDALDEYNVPAIYYAVVECTEAAAIALIKVTDFQLLSNMHEDNGTNTLDEAIGKSLWGFIKATVANGLNPYAKNLNGQSLLEVINRSNLELEPKKALIAELKYEHAWAKRGALVMLRRRFKQAWEAECDASEAAADAAQALSAAPDA